MNCGPGDEDDDDYDDDDDDADGIGDDGMDGPEVDEDW